MVGARLWALPNWLNQLQEKNKRHEIQEHSGYRGDRDCCIRCWLLQPVRFFFDGSGDRARYRTGHRPSDRSGGSRRYGSGDGRPCSSRGQRHQVRSGYRTASRVPSLGAVRP